MPVIVSVILSMDEKSNVYSWQSYYSTILLFNFGIYLLRMKIHPMLFNIIPTFIIIGAGIMILSIVKTRRILQLLTSRQEQKQWQILFNLMIFFVLVYLIAFFIFIYQLIDLITILAGIVFFLGSLFVFFSVNIYYSTLATAIKLKEESRQARQELESHLSEFKHSQSQLIHQEKMLSLGQIVAGVAHEINNPISFIHGNIEYLDNHINVLLFLLELYQQEFPHATPEIHKKISENEIEFVKEDLPKLFSSMKAGTKRIREIVKLLRTFSRMDEAEVKSVDIHAGIDSTLMILQHRLQVRSEHQKIRIIKNYGAISKVECYAGQLNQVFMNIITNAIDALEEKHNNYSYQEILNHPKIITITTAMNEYQQLEISISDNGNGIPESVQKHIFEPFYTTKPVGKGTGLGLSISYEIIRKHHGNIDFVSTPGKGTKFMIQIPIQIQ
ncbi:MAG: GHKL domain-containing protein [Nostocales cyanobacterium]|nr:MAG: GHKL domain-containing protein [Nostocales cyanobacterium]